MHWHQVFKIIGHDSISFYNVLPNYNFLNYKLLNF